MESVEDATDKTPGVQSAPAVRDVANLTAEDGYFKLKMAKLDKIVSLTGELSSRKHLGGVHHYKLLDLSNKIKEGKRICEAFQEKLMRFVNGIPGNDASTITKVLNDVKNHYEKLGSSLDEIVVSNQFLKDRESKLIGELQREVFQARMVTINDYFRRLKRTVRDIVKGSNKKIRLQFEGLQTELDKRLLEEIKDPMVHLIRNAIDHGIEEPDLRKKAGKPEEGTVKISAHASGSEVTIKIEDDGRGIDKEKVGKRAVENGLVNKSRLKQMTSQEIILLIFEPGFSTKENVTQISGRGVGMDVVKSNIEKISGYINVENHPGEGVRFFLKIPVTLAAFKAVLCKTGSYSFYIQSIAVDRVIRVASREKRPLGAIAGIVVRNKQYPYAYLGEYFSVEPGSTGTSGYFFIILRAGDKSIALEVDECIEQQDIVIKPKADIVSQLPYLSGVVTRPDGTLAYVLEPAELIGHVHDGENRSAGGNSWFVDSSSESSVENILAPFEETRYNIAEQGSKIELLHFINDSSHYGVPVQSVVQVCNLTDASLREQVDSSYDSIVRFVDKTVSLEKLPDQGKETLYQKSGKAAVMLKSEDHHSILIPDKLLNLEVFDIPEVNPVKKTGKWKNALPDIVKIMSDVSGLN